MQMLDDHLASVQASFEPVFWVHEDAETILRFAEKSICGRLEYEYEVRNLGESLSSQAAQAAMQKVAAILKKEYEDSIEANIASKTLVYSLYSDKQNEITREQALTFVGKESFRVQDRTNNAYGQVADVFTIKETREQVTGPEFISIAPFVGRRITASFELRKIDE